MADFNSSDILLESDPFGDVDTNSTWNESAGLYGHAFFEYFFIISNFLKFIAGVVNIVADIILIVVMTKYKRLNTRINRYIFHYVIGNLMYLVGCPILFLIGHLSGTMYLFAMISYQLETSSIAYSIIFTFALAVDWAISVFKPEWLVKYKKYHNISFHLIYTIWLVDFIINCIIRLTDNTTGYMNFWSTRVIGAIGLVTILILSLMRCFMKLPNEPVKISYALTIATTIMACWLPVLAIHYLYIYTPSMSWVFYIQDFLYEFFDILSFGSTIVVCYMLARLNKHFKMAFDRIYKRSVQTYDDDDLDESSKNDTLANNNTVQVENSTDNNEPNTVIDI